MRRPYFPPQEGSPDPLRYKVNRRIRLEEVDPLGIVWHGRYPSFFEDARLALGEHYGMGYMDCYNQGLVTPIKIMHVEYFRPLHFNETIEVEGIWHWTEASRINMEFIIISQDELVATTGYTVQMILDRELNVQVFQPAFYAEFCRRWRDGEL
jgi:acyl-CoA thioester hydrolase